MKEELIDYVMGKADQYYSDDFPIYSIEVWIREFFDQYQPERSNPEEARKPLKEDIIKLLDRKFINSPKTSLCDDPNSEYK